MSANEQLIAKFLEEARERLEEIEEVLLELEGNPSDNEAINRLFRAFHTIKGSGAMFGFDQLADFTHHVETLLNQIRDGIVEIGCIAAQPCAEGWQILGLQHQGKDRSGEFRSKPLPDAGAKRL